MSIQTFKKKGIITSNGVKISGKSSYRYWISQGPHGPLQQNNILPFGKNGFSLEGSRRTGTYIGKSYRMSKSGTPFYGQFPIGWGGTNGKYPKAEPLLNCPEVLGDVRGKQFEYVKPSVLSTKGMLERKYKWIHNGIYPNYWVQPVYPNSNLSDNSSQGVYIHNVAASNICVNNTNKFNKFIGYYRPGGATGCSTTPALYKSYNIISQNGLYTKMLNIPQQSSQYTLQIQRKCTNPTGIQKPFPYAANNTCTPSIASLSSSTVQSGSKGPPIGMITPVYLTPPEWYTQNIM